VRPGDALRLVYLRGLCLRESHFSLRLLQLRPTTGTLRGSTPSSNAWTWGRQWSFKVCYNAARSLASLEGRTLTVAGEYMPARVELKQVR
jgi:hypothetical protein